MIDKTALIQDSRTLAADLITVCDIVRYAVSRFNEGNLAYGQGASNAFDEAIFIALEHLRLPIDTIEPYWMARLLPDERAALIDLIHRRIETRLPAAYLLNKSYCQGYSFYVDENVLIPRSFIAEILCQPHGFSQIDDYAGVTRVLDLCTGSACLAIIAASLFPNATVDAVDLSGSALNVARRNVADYQLENRITLYQGDLLSPLSGQTYDLVICNPPYVDQPGMSALPPEFRHEPAMALTAGADGLDIVRRLLTDVRPFLKEDGKLLCEVGRCGPALEAAYPQLPFLWIDTQGSFGEVFVLPARALD